jgi:hypothetical protein
MGAMAKGGRMALLLRYVTAIVGAALAPALLVGLATGQANIVFLAFIVALAHAVFIGLPAALVFQRLGWLSLPAALAAGFLIGALPLGLIFAVLPQADFASVGGVPTAIDRRLTLAGWVGLLQAAALFGVLGGLGGLTAWLIWRASSRASWAWGLSVIALAGAVLAGPTLFMDRSCHNPLHDGRGSLAPQLHASLPIASAEWPALTEIFQVFAASNRWSFRNSSGPSSAQALDLSVCSAEGTQIMAVGRIWPNTPEMVQDHSVSISIYQPQGGTSWHDPSRRLIAAIEQRWPGKLTFRDETGRDTQPPGFLRLPAKP